MAVIGCDIPVRQVVGADKLAQARAGLWTKTHFYQSGNYLCAKTFLVAAGEPSILEFRIDLRPLEKVAARIHQRMHERAAAAADRQVGSRQVRSGSGSGSGSDLTPYPLLPTPAGSAAVGFSFAKAFRSIKNTAKKIGKTKLIKAVGGAIKTVAKSKLVGTLAAGLAVAVPVVGLPALAAYGSAKAAIGAVNTGKKLTSKAQSAQRTLSTAASLTGKLSAAKTQAPARAQADAVAVQQRATAQARQIANKAQTRAAVQPSLAAARAVQAAAAAKARVTLAAGKAQATAAAKGVVAQVQSAAARVAPVVQAAAQLQAQLADPAVRAKLTTIKARAQSANQVLSDIKEKAAHGSGAEKLDAQKSAAIVNLVAKNEARIQAMSQANAGGLPSLLIDARGRIVPGKFRIVAQGGGKNPDVLYRGPKATTERGSFARVSGEQIVGTDHHPDGHWTIEIKNHHQPNVWHSQAVYGARYLTHAAASKAAAWYANEGLPVRVVNLHTGKIHPRIAGDEIVGASSKYPSAVQRPWTIELWGNGRWNPQYKHGAHFGTHAEASQALQWYNHNGYTAQVAPYPRIKTQPKNRIGAVSPFAPLSPREQRAKDAAYAAWLRQHAPAHRARVGGNTPFVGYSPPAVATTIGCPCSDQGTLF